jgi:hypothetical protein
MDQRPTAKELLKAWDKAWEARPRSEAEAIDITKAATGCSSILSYRAADSDTIILRFEFESWDAVMIWVDPGEETFAYELVWGSEVRGRN